MFEKIQLKFRKGHGFEPDIITPDNYIFGAKQLSSKILRPDGQWDEFLPIDELQKKNGVETMNCTVYGTLNGIEILHKALYGYEENYAERFTGILAETTTRGNGVHKVAEIIRKNGLIDETSLPFDDTIISWYKYYSPKPMTEEYTNEGKVWISKYEFLHEWTFISGWNNVPIAEKQKVMMEALKRSPLGVSVYAWLNDNGLYWKPHSKQDNHWVICYGYEEGRYWKIFDSYDNTKKKLRWDYNFGFSKKFYLNKLTDEMPMATTIKKKDQNEIYVQSLTDPSKIYWIGGWESYSIGLKEGWVKEYKEVDSLRDFMIQDGIWGLLK